MADDNEVIDIGEEGEGSSKKKLFIIIGVVVLLIIGAAAAFFLMGGEDEAADPDKTEEVAEEEPEEEGEKIPSHYALPGVKEPGLIIPLQPGTAFRNAEISLKFFTYNQGMIDYLSKNDPMIRHHMINTLSTLESSKFTTRAGREEIQAALKAKVVEVLENSKSEEDKKLANKLEDIYFDKFVLE